MKEQPRTKLRIIYIYKKKMQIPQNVVYKKILRTRNRCCKFIKNLVPEKRKENM